MNSARTGGVALYRLLGWHLAGTSPPRRASVRPTGGRLPGRSSTGSLDAGTFDYKLLE